MTDFSDHPRSIAELRSDKENNAALWTPRDCLIDCLRKIDSGEIDPTAMVIVYGKETSPGCTKSSWSAASPNVLVTLGLLEYSKHQIFESSGGD